MDSESPKFFGRERDRPRPPCLYGSQSEPGVTAAPGGGGGGETQAITNWEGKGKQEGEKSEK